MAKILSGKEVSARIKDELRKEAEGLKERGIMPGLAVIIVGDDPASRVYVNNKKKACAFGSSLPNTSVYGLAAPTLSDAEHPVNINAQTAKITHPHSVPAGSLLFAGLFPQ